MPSILKEILGSENGEPALDPKEKRRAFIGLGVGVVVGTATMLANRNLGADVQDALLKFSVLSQVYGVIHFAKAAFPTKDALPDRVKDFIDSHQEQAINFRDHARVSLANTALNAFAVGSMTHDQVEEGARQTVRGANYARHWLAPSH